MENTRKARNVLCNSKWLVGNKLLLIISVILLHRTTFAPILIGIQHCAKI